MKYCLVLLALVTTCFAQVRVGKWEQDFVWSALKPEPADNFGYAMGSVSPLAYHVAQHWKRPPGSWKAFAEAAALKVTAELVGAGWQVAEIPGGKAGEDRPYSFELAAEKGSEKIHCYVTLIPADEKSFYASYVQTAQ